MCFPAMAAAKELALTRRAALEILLDLGSSPGATDRYEAVSALSGIAGVDPAIVRALQRKSCRISRRCRRRRRPASF